MKNIPLHQLQERSATGLEVEYFRVGEEPYDEALVLGAHRDDHYIFFLLEKGAASIMVDFEQIDIGEGMLYYVLPAQVHHRIKNRNAQGWFVALDTALIPPACRDVFETRLALQQPVLLDNALLLQFGNLLSLLQARRREGEEDRFHLTVMHALAHSFVGMAAACFDVAGDNIPTAVSRLRELTGQFKKLLAEHDWEKMSPAAFAERLNVSTAYLSEAVKAVTGFPAGYWIEVEILIEAKRLLFYTQCTVKEIAHMLGFEDHAYFGRFFRKGVGVTPLAFRAQYRK